MKRLPINIILNFNQLNALSSRKIFLPLLLALVLFSGLPAAADIPVVKLKFDNPKYDCPTHTYFVDVMFKSNTPNQQFFGMNVRFFYDDNILEFLGIVCDKCISTTCGIVIPVANWSLFLAIGLMLMVSVFIYWRRINS